MNNENFDNDYDDGDGYYDEHGYDDDDYDDYGEEDKLNIRTRFFIAIKYTIPVLLRRSLKRIKNDKYPVANIDDIPF